MYRLASLDHDGYNMGRETDDFVTALMWATEILATEKGWRYNQRIRIYYDGEVDRKGAKKLWEDKILPTFESVQSLVKKKNLGELA